MVRYGFFEINGNVFISFSLIVLLALLLLRAFFETDFEGLIIFIFQVKLVFATVTFEYLSIFFNKVFPEEKKVLSFSKIELRHVLIEFGQVVGILVGFIPFLIDHEYARMSSNLISVVLITAYLIYLLANTRKMKVSSIVKVLERTW